MSKRCDICGKGSIVGHKVSHSHNLSKKRWLPNIQKVRVLENGRSVRKNVCTRCLSAGKVKKPV